MNFDFSEEQEALRDQARRFLADGPEWAREALGEQADFHADAWRYLTELGWVAAAVPEEHGGLGLGPLELCVLAEEMGRSLAPLPFSSSVLQATEALKLGGGKVAEQWLPQLAAGEIIGTLAFSEGTPGTWMSRPRAKVVDGRLSGQKTPIADGLVAGLAIVSAVSDEDGDGFGWWLVQLNSPEVKRDEVATVDCVRKHAAITFDGALVERLGKPGEGEVLAEKLLDMVAVFTAFEQLGGAEAAMAMALDYVNTREAFGRVVGGYQAVKHKLADMYVKIELARSHAYFGAWALDNGAQELAKAAAGARLAALDAYGFSAEESIELHGGIGFTWESNCQLFYRRARLLASHLGGRVHWSQRLVKSLVGEKSDSTVSTASDVR